MSSFQDSLSGARTAGTSAAREKKGWKKYIKMVGYGTSVLILFFGVIGAIQDFFGDDSPSTSPSASDTGAVKADRSKETIRPSKGPFQIFLDKGEESGDLRVKGDECILGWGKDLDGNAFTTYVRDVEKKTEWLKWERWERLKEIGQAPYENFGWMKFKGNQHNAEVNYAYWPRHDYCD